MKIRKNFWLLLILVCLPVAPGADDSFSMQEISSGVYVHTGSVDLVNSVNKGDIANIGFVVGDESVAVIDTGGSGVIGQELKAYIESVTELPVRYIILTHAHPDHIFGTGAFERQGEPPDVVGHANLARAIAQRSEYYSRRLQDESGLGPDEFGLLPQTIFVESRARLDLGNRPLVLTAFETAHTDNDLAVLDESSGTLWTGDLVFRSHVPVVDGSIRGWMRVLEELQGLDVNYVVSGHGDVAQNWEAAVSAQTAYFRALVDGVAAAIEQGMPIQQAVEEVAGEQENQWLLFSQFHPQNVSRVYAELEWE